MNKSQKIIAVVVVLLIVAMCFLPPFYYFRNSLGWHPVFDRPSEGQVDVRLLSFQIIVVILLGVIIGFVFQNKQPNAK